MKVLSVRVEKKSIQRCAKFITEHNITVGHVEFITKTYGNIIARNSVFVRNLSDRFSIRIIHLIIENIIPQIKSLTCPQRPEKSETRAGFTNKKSPGFNAQVDRHVSGCYII